MVHLMTTETMNSDHTDHTDRTDHTDHTEQNRETSQDSGLPLRGHTHTHTTNRSEL